jgi:class 3 adenylate cyclase
VSLLLALGEAERRAGESARAGDTFQRAAEAARRLGAPEAIARAALGFGHGFMPSAAGIIDEYLVGLLEEALGLLGPEDSVLRARVLGRLVRELTWSPDRERREAFGRAAVDMARRLGDPATLAYVLYARHFALWAPENLAERLEVASEIVRLAEATGDREMSLEGHDLRLIDLLEQGDIRAVDEELAAYSRLAEELRQPKYLWYETICRAMRAFLQGRFVLAEELAQEALARGHRVQAAEVASSVGSVIYLLRMEQGRLAEMEEAIRGFAARYPSMPAFRTPLAFLYCDLGREAEARQEFDDLARDDFAGLPTDQTWLLAVAHLSEVCARLGDAARARTLHRLLAPYAERNIARMPICLGSAARHLGLLAATLGRFDEAGAHFENALRMNETMGALPWVAHTQHDFAAMLLARGAPGDRERAVRLLGLALDTAQGLGMRSLVERVLALRLRLQGATDARATSSIDAIYAAVESEHPDLRPHAAADGTVTILFSDIEGFTTLTERLGDHRAHEVLRAHNALIRGEVRRHRGVEVKSRGDGFMVAFTRPAAALHCAVGIQRALDAFSAEHPETPVRVRIGAHTGEVIAEAQDFFGRTVIVAARVADAARGGEILVSEALREQVHGEAKVTFADSREVELKGLRGRWRVYGVAA